MPSLLSLCILFAAVAASLSASAPAFSVAFIAGNGHRCTTTTARQIQMLRVLPEGTYGSSHRLASHRKHGWGNWHVASGGSSAGRARPGAEEAIISMPYGRRHLLSLSSSSPSDDRGGEESSSSGKSRRRKRRRVRKKDGGSGEGGGESQGESEAVYGQAEAVVVGEAETRGEEEVVAAGSVSSVVDDGNEFVEVKVRDIRDMGRGGKMGIEQGGRIGEAAADADGGDFASSSGAGDDLDRLLADARRMRASSGVSKSEEDEVSIGDTVTNIISTIVTVDFFVVCALLLWFLAGIFCSYVLKDDAVQIAFNGIFQPVVQPALGILMIASAAGAMMKKDDEK